MVSLCTTRAVITVTIVFGCTSLSLIEHKRDTPFTDQEMVKTFPSYVVRDGVLSQAVLYELKKGF